MRLNCQTLEFNFKTRWLFILNFGIKLKKKFDLSTMLNRFFSFFGLPKSAKLWLTVFLSCCKDGEHISEEKSFDEILIWNLFSKLYFLFRWHSLKMILHDEEKIFADKRKEISKQLNDILILDKSSTQLETFIITTFYNDYPYSM